MNALVAVLLVAGSRGSHRSWIHLAARAAPSGRRRSAPAAPQAKAGARTSVGQTGPRAGAAEARKRRRSRQRSNWTRPVSERAPTDDLGSGRARRPMRCAERSPMSSRAARSRRAGGESGGGQGRGGRAAQLAARAELDQREQRLASREVRIDERSERLTRKPSGRCARAWSWPAPKPTSRGARPSSPTSRKSAAASSSRSPGSPPATPGPSWSRTLESQAKRDAALIVRDIEAEARDEGEERARRIVTLAIQRVASEQTAESVVSRAASAQRRHEGPDHRPRRPQHPRLRGRHRRQRRSSTTPRKRCCCPASTRCAARSAGSPSRR